jgi:hypothetical protein
MTDAGQAAIEGAAPGHVAATRRYFFGLLSDQEVDLLTSVCARVLANLDQSPGSIPAHRAVQPRRAG